MLAVPDIFITNLTMRLKPVAREITEIKNELMALSAKERSEIARDLLLSLEDSSEGDVEKEWILEAESRYEAYRQGNSTTRPVSAALASAKEKK